MKEIKAPRKRKINYIMFDDILKHLVEISEEGAILLNHYYSNCHFTLTEFLDEDSFVYDLMFKDKSKEALTYIYNYITDNNNYRKNVTIQFGSPTKCKYFTKTAFEIHKICADFYDKNTVFDLGAISNAINNFSIKLKDI